MKRQLLLITVTFTAMMVNAQTLQTGGQFMDLLLPMEGTEAATASDWGTEAGESDNDRYPGSWAGTLGRWKDNGIEDDARSYWGGNIIKGGDGKYHIYVSGWPSDTKGHMDWSSASRVYHVTSDNVWGPYTYVSDIGPGHNSEIYKTGGTYVIYHIEPLGYYYSSTLGDTWSEGTYTFDLRDRKLIAGENRETSLSNCTFAKREDGSFVMMDRGGGIWVSRDGLSDPWHQLTDASVYLNSKVRNRGTLEDPVIWRDHLQYHMVVNDWNARQAYYYRSKDALHWVMEDGKAYTGEDPFARHSSGEVERWHKYERPRVYQDEQGRAIRMNFAVIDCVKQFDLPGDKHSSKNINMPLTRQLLLEVQTISATSATVLVKAEEGFDPMTDLDFQSLTFGSHDRVNNGGGFTYSTYAASGSDVVITFAGNDGDSGIGAGEWAPKMLGQKTDGTIAFGYARMPGVDYRPAMLSALTPVIAADGTVQRVSVSNYGQSAAAATTVQVWDEGGSTLLAHGTTSALAAYGTKTVELAKDNAATAGYKSLQVRFLDGATLLNTENIALTAINAAQTALQTVIVEAQAMYDDASLANGKEDLKTAIDEASDVAGCYDVETLEAQQAKLTAALNAYKYANASPTNGQSITIENSTMDAIAPWTVTRDKANGDNPGWSINKNGNNYSGFSGNFMEYWVGGGAVLGHANSASQTLADMPAGRYRLRAKVIACNQSTGSAVTGVTLFANGTSTTCATANNAPQEYMIEVTMAEAGNLTIGLNVEASTTANWVAWDNVSLKYFGNAGGTIVEEATATFDASKTYYIKNANRQLSYVYLKSPKYNAENDNNLYRTNNVAEAAQVKVTGVYDDAWSFYLYDVVSHRFLVPSANNNNGTAWAVSATKPAKVRIADNTDNRNGTWALDPAATVIYTMTNGDAGVANAYSNDNAPYEVKNYGTVTNNASNQWLFLETGSTSGETMGVDPQAVYRLKHYNTARNRYMKAPTAESTITATSTDGERGEYALLPVGGQAGYYYIQSTNGYFVTPAAGNWTYSKSTPAAVKVEANIQYMEAKSGGSNVTYLLGETSQHANVQTVDGVQVVKNYDGHPSDNGNNWMLETVDNATAAIRLNGITSGLEPIVSSAAAAGTALSYTATVGTAGFGTLVVPFDAEVEGQVEAYKLTSVNSSDMIVGERVTAIEANRPVLLKEQGTLVLTAKEGTAAYSASPTSGLLTGVYAATEAPVDAYVLQNLDEGAGFYKVETGHQPTVGPFRAYLTAPGAARRLLFLFGDESSVGHVSAVSRVEEVFSLSGMRQSVARQGLSIVRMSDGSVRKVFSKF